MLREGLITLSEYNADNFLGLQVDVYGEENGSCEAGEPWHPFGFSSRPRDPERDTNGEIDPAKAAGALYEYLGSKIHVLPVGDPRVNPKLPVLNKGSSIQYSATGAFILVEGGEGDGSITAYAPTAFSGETPTAAHLLQLDKQGNQVVLRHASGGGVTVTAGSAAMHANGGSVYVETSDSGIVLNGNTVTNGGMTIGSPTGAMPIALAPPLLAYLTGLEVALRALAVAVDAKLVPTPDTTTKAVEAALSSIVIAKATITATLASAV